MSSLRPSLAFLFLGSALAFSFACGGGNDDDDKGAANTNTPGASATPGGTSTGSPDAGASPLGGLGALLGDSGIDSFFGEGGIASIDPCSVAPQACRDGAIDIGAISSAACSLDPSLCSDAGAGGNFIGNLGGIFGGGAAGGGPGGSGASDAGAQPSDAGSSSASDAASPSGSDAMVSGDAR